MITGRLKAAAASGRTEADVRLRRRLDSAASIDGPAAEPWFARPRDGGGFYVGLAGVGWNLADTVVADDVATADRAILLAAAPDAVAALELCYSALMRRIPKGRKTLLEWATAAAAHPASECVRLDAEAALALIAALRKAGSVLV